jgi:trimeric autotransporter adhesin
MALRKIDPTMIGSQIPTSKIADGAITTDKLAANAVTSEKVADGTIAPADITSQVATTGKALSVAIALG